MTCTAGTHQTDHPGRAIITNLLTTRHHLLPPARMCSIVLEIKERNTIHATVKDASEIANHRNRFSDCRSISLTHEHTSTRGTKALSSGTQTVHGVLALTTMHLITSTSPIRCSTHQFQPSLEPLARTNRIHLGVADLTVCEPQATKLL